MTLLNKKTSAARWFFCLGILI